MPVGSGAEVGQQIGPSRRLGRTVGPEDRFLRIQRAQMLPSNELIFCSRSVSCPSLPVLRARPPKLGVRGGVALRHERPSFGVVLALPV